MDPFAGSLQDPQSMHKYLYCHANPINNIDPSGSMALALQLNISMVIKVAIFSIVAYDVMRAMLGLPSFTLAMMKLTEAILTGFIDLTKNLGIAAWTAVMSTYSAITEVIRKIRLEFPKIKKFWRSGNYDLCVQTFTPPFRTPAKYITFGVLPLSLQVGGMPSHIAGLCLSNKITRNPRHEFTIFRLDYNPYPRTTTSLFVLHWHSDLWPGHHEILRWPPSSI
jgi:hypothetical protein